MSKYKLVPMEPTDEMVDAAADAYMPFGDMDIAIRMALLAAPYVQRGSRWRRLCGRTSRHWWRRYQSLVIMFFRPWKRKS